MTLSWLPDTDFPVPCVVREEPVTREESLVSGDNAEYLLVIVHRHGQASVALMGNTLKFRQIPHLGSEIISPAEVWHGGKQESELRCPTRNSPLISLRMLVRSKVRLWPWPHHRKRDHYWFPVSHAVQKHCAVKIKHTWKSLYCTADKLNCSPEFSLLLMKSVLLSKRWVYFGSKTPCLPTSSFCITALRYVH